MVCVSTRARARAYMHTCLGSMYAGAHMSRAQLNANGEYTVQPASPGVRTLMSQIRKRPSGLIARRMAARAWGGEGARHRLRFIQRDWKAYQAVARCASSRIEAAALEQAQLARRRAIRAIRPGDTLTGRAMLCAHSSACKPKTSAMPPPPAKASQMRWHRAGPSPSRGAPCRAGRR